MTGFSNFVLIKYGTANSGASMFKNVDFEAKPFGDEIKLFNVII